MLNIPLIISANTRAAITQLQALAGRITSTFNRIQIPNPTQGLQNGLQGMSTSLIAIRGLYALAASEAAKFFFNAAKSADNAAKSFTALKLAAKAAGVSASEAGEVAAKLAADGRITQEASSQAVATLLSSGEKNLDFIQRYLETLKNFSAIFGNTNMSLNDTVTSVASAIKTGNSETLDNSGIPTNASVYLEQYARSIGTVATSLTQAEQSAALTTGTLADMQRLLGDSVPEATRFSVAVGALDTSWSRFQKSVGNNTSSITSTFVEGFSVILDWSTQVIDAIGRMGTGFVGLFKKSRAAVDEAKDIPAPTGQPAAPAPMKGVPEIKLGRDGKPIGALPPIPGAPATTPPPPPFAQRTGETMGDYQTRKKRESEDLDRSTKVFDAIGNARVKAAESSLNKETAAINDAQTKRKVTGVEAARKLADSETRAKLVAFEDLQRQLAAVNEALEQNQTGTGKPFDITREVELRTQKTQLLSDSLSLGDEIETARIKSATDIYSAEIELAQQSADIRSAKYTEAIEAGQVEFLANLDFERAKLDEALEARTVGQREYIERTKKMRLAEIAEEDRQNKLRLADLKQQAAVPGADPAQRAQLQAQIVKLNADIAASTKRRATAEVEALTKVLQLEEQLQQTRATLAEQQLSLQGKTYEAQLESIRESVRQFNKEFAGDDEASVRLRAQRASNAQLETAKATFDEQKRLIDERGQFESVAIERINLLRDTGAISARQAEKDIQAEKLKTIEVIEAQVVALEALAVASNNTDMVLAAEQARAAFERLKLEGIDPMAASLNRTISDSIGARIQDWITKTLHWKDALRSVFMDIFGDLAKRYLKAFTDDLFTALEGEGKPGGKQGVGGLLTGLFDGEFGLGGLIARLMGGLKVGFVGLFNGDLGAGNLISTIVSGLSSGLKSVFSGLDLGGLFSGIAQMFGGSGGGVGSLFSGIGSMLGFATGGPVWGAGTGTSDSIFAKLSNGEFVLTAAAHKKWGTGFLQMLNAGVMPNFAMPAFATGGAVGDLFGVGGGAPQVTVQNNNTSRLYLDPAHVASEIGRTPQFGRDVIAVMMANKGKLGLP